MRLRAQSTVEMALIMIILIPLVIGAVDLGRAYFDYDLLVHAVNEGVRRGSTDSNTANVVAAVQAAAVRLNLPAGNVTVTCYAEASTTIKTCSSVVIGDSIRVAASSSFIPATPWLSNFLPGGQLSLSAVAQRTYQ